MNSGIPREALDGSSFKLRLPSPLVLANMIMKRGPGCRLYKIDLSRAYQQLRGDPLDWPMMGVSWENEFYVDLAVPFGLRHGASACQRVSEAAASVAAHDYGADTVPYVDDTAGEALENEAQAHYDGLLSTCDKMGWKWVYLSVSLRESLCFGSGCGTMRSTCLWPSTGKECWRRWSCAGYL